MIPIQQHLSAYIEAMLSMQLDQAYNVIALDYSCENGGCTSRESRDPEGVKLRVRVVITPGLYDCVFGD